MARPLRTVSRGGRSDYALVGDVKELAELGALLKATGDKTLFRKTQKALADGTKPAKDEVAKSARETLPQRGGLAEYIAGVKIVTRVRVSGRNVGVRLRSSQAKGYHASYRRRAAKKGARSRGNKEVTSTAFGAGEIDLNALNRGRGKHPTFGHRPWVIQVMNAGFWTKAMTGPVAFEVRKDLLRMVDEIKRELVSKHGRGAA